MSTTHLDSKHLAKGSCYRKHGPQLGLFLSPHKRRIQGREFKRCERATSLYEKQKCYPKQSWGRKYILIEHVNIAGFG